MLRRRVLILGLLAGLFMGAMPVGDSAKARDEISVGDFAVMVAARLGSVKAGESLTSAQASDILVKRGVRAAAHPSSPLTEQAAVEFFRPFGITLRSGRPQETIEPDRAAALLNVFGSTLSGKDSQADHVARMVRQLAGGTVGLDDLTPLDCQSLVPPSPCGGGGQPSCNPCMDCCKNQLGLSGKDCGQLCQKKNLIVSPTDPTP
jgi:hypothetical protein